MATSDQTLQTVNALQSMGLSLPSPAYLMGSVVFSLIGWVAYRQGKQRESKWTRWLGVILMVYPYAVSDTKLLYAIGAALCLAIYATRNN